MTDRRGTSSGEAVALEAGASVDGPRPSGKPPADYEVRLRRRDRTRSSRPLRSRSPRAGATPTLSLDAATYPSGEPITATWRDAPGSRWDWIGVYARGGDPLVDYYLYYVYTGQDVQGSVVIDESGEGDWPLPAGRVRCPLPARRRLHLARRRAPSTVTE